MSRLLYDGKRSANFVGFANVDYARDFDSRKSTLGHCFTLVGGVVSWSSKRQTSTTLSSIEEKYMSFIEPTKEVVWLKKLLGDLGYQQLVATPLYCDNQSP
jgi:histone deacetylase 1/2